MEELKQHWPWLAGSSVHYAISTAHGDPLPELFYQPEQSWSPGRIDPTEGNQVKRRFRLRKTTDFKRVRRLGKSYAHPFIVLIALKNDQDTPRFAAAAGRTVGNAVQRNRAKRLIRESLRTLIPNIEPGWDIVILARRPIIGATFQQAQSAIVTLLHKAGLLKQNHGE